MPKRCRLPQNVRLAETGGIWDDLPGVFVQLHEIADDIFPDSEDEAEAGRFSAMLEKPMGKPTEVSDSEVPVKPPALKVRPL